MVFSTGRATIRTTPAPYQMIARRNRRMLPRCEWNGAPKTIHRVSATTAATV